MNDATGIAEASTRRITRDLAELARELRKHSRSLDDVLDRVTAAAVEMIPGADYACLLLVTNKKRVVRASTDPLADELCRDQYLLGQGPIENEIRHLDVVVSQDLGEEPRWPEFAARALEKGVRSLAAFQLFTDAGDLGVLIAYSRRSGAFGSDAEIIGGCLAAHAAIAMAGARDHNNFTAGLASRDIIGQAKGMLMERFSIDAVQAFDLLSQLSQTENRPLHEIAQKLVEIDHPATMSDQD